MDATPSMMLSWKITAYKQMIPLAPEAIRNAVGTENQGCEINAGKRLIEKIGKKHPKLKIVFSGNDIFSNYPFIYGLKN